MNETIWITLNKVISVLEVIGQLSLGGIIILVYAYGMFLCCAVYDYQDEKPEEEKCLVDYQIKDWMNSQFYFLYYIGFVQFIALFSSPITFYNFVYPLCYLGVFLFHFQCATVFFYLYIQYVYTFQPDDIKDINICIYRRKCLLWKLFITCITVLISIWLPLEDQPILFQLLTNGVEYNR